VVEALQSVLEPHGGKVDLHPEDGKVVLTVRAPTTTIQALAAALEAEGRRRRGERARIRRNGNRGGMTGGYGHESEEQAEAFVVGQS
jgi:hypothetical protein